MLLLCLNGNSKIYSEAAICLTEEAAICLTEEAAICDRRSCYLLDRRTLILAKTFNYSILLKYEQKSFKLSYSERGGPCLSNSLCLNRSILSTM